MRIKVERGFTLIELMVVVAVVGILAAIAAHQLLRARAAANEASAIGTLRAIASGQQGFAATCGSGYYADELDTLVAGNHISPDANMTPKSGFSFELEPGADSGRMDCGGNMTTSTFYITAIPLTRASGNRGFAANQNNTIWQDITGVAPEEPFLQTEHVTPIH